MQQYGLLGYPLTYSLSPAMHNAAFEALGMDAAYELWPTHPDALPHKVDALRHDPRLGGFNITVPHKQVIMPLLDDISPAARAVGAVNTVIRSGWTSSPQDCTLNGENTDVYGFQQMLQEAGVPVQGARVLVLGAGGAARAVIYTLLQMGADRVLMLNRTQEKAAQLLQDLQAGERGEVVVSPSFSSISLIINATSSQDPWPGCGLTSRQVWSYGQGFAVDLMYGNMLSGFLEQAGHHGWQTLSGEGMLLYQAARAFELWTGQAAPVEVMRSALMRTLRG